MEAINIHEMMDEIINRSRSRTDYAGPPSPHLSNHHKALIYPIQLVVHKFLMLKSGPTAVDKAISKILSGMFRTYNMDINDPASIIEMLNGEGGVNFAIGLEIDLIDNVSAKLHFAVSPSYHLGGVLYLPEACDLMQVQSAIDQVAYLIYHLASILCIPTESIYVSNMFAPFGSEYGYEVCSTLLTPTDVTIH